ncbi:MAG: thioredoxin family protein [Hydrogenothermaceae bacterium]|nr:thioredoxin family protein [Hydrogenothermaceae bacterium]
MKKIQIVSSSNCKNCELLYEVVSTIVKKKGIDAQLEKVVDIKEVVKYGVMTTPLLVVDGKLKHSGAPIPAPQQIEKLISE